MEIEKIAPIAKSPLDACRGRGKFVRHSPRPVKDPRTPAEETLPKTVVLIVLPDSPFPERRASGSMERKLSAHLLGK